MRHCALLQPRHLAMQVSKNTANNEICTRLRHKAGAQGAALYSHARRSAWPRPAKRTILCVAIGDRAPPRWYSVLGRWLVDLRIVLRVVGQLALARLRTFCRHVLAIEDWNKREGTRHSNCSGRHHSSIGLFKARSCQMVDRMRHMVVANSLRRAAPDTERVTTGIVARSIPSCWSVTSRRRECATTQMRHPRTIPSAPFTSDVRRGLLRARTMTPLANSHQLFGPIHCNSPVRGPTNSRIDSAFRTSRARRLKIRIADAGVMTSPTLLQASSK